MAVLVIYTGGTIGSLHQDREDRLSPLVPGTWQQLIENVPAIKQLPFEVKVHEFKPLLDSSNMKPINWVEIAKIIRDDYDKYEGFVILHGTDTMTYTATALSFILENLSKPVVLTGSQLPIGEVRSDAVQNLISALQIAAPKSMELPVVPEVCIFFQNKLIRGNRSKKINASGYDAFDSPNYPLLGTAGEHIDINKDFLLTPSESRFYINEKIETNVMSLDVFPGIRPEVLRNIVKTEGLRGLVLKTFGTGNAPTDERFLDAIEDGVKSGVVVVDVTQCLKGMVEIGLYETSAELLNRGVVSGLDMTPEAALAKLQYLLGLFSSEEVRRYIQLDKCGEQSMNIYDVDYGDGEANPISNLSPKQIPGQLRKEALRNAVIRVQGVKLPKTKEPCDFTVKAFINLPSVDQDTPPTVPQCAGYVPKEWKQEPLNLFFNATKAAETVLNPQFPVSVTLVTDTESISWKKLILSVYAEVQRVRR